MQKEYRQYQLEIHAMSDDGIIEGVASATEVYIEGYHEVVAKGAFKKTIKETKGKVSVFKAHDPDVELGTTLKMWEDDIGLNFIAEMLINDDPFHVPEARTEWALMKQKFDLGIKRGISIGFQAMVEGVRKKFKGMKDVRDLIELRVFEISPTPFPANKKAGITQLRNELNVDPDTLRKTIEFLNSHGHKIDFDKLMEQVSTHVDEPEHDEPDILHSFNQELENVINRLNEGVKSI